MKRIAVLVLMLFPYGIYTSQVQINVKTKTDHELNFASTNTYYGQEITPENIIQLAPKIDPDVAASVQNFLLKNSPIGNIFSGASYYNPILFSMT